MTDQFKEEPLQLGWIDGRKWEVLSEDFDWTDKKGRRVCVPAGFVTDFASIPRAMWPVLPPTGKYGKAAVLHDFMYQEGVWCDGTPCTRGDADGVLKEAMADLGVRWTQRWTIYAGVRSGGWVSWRKYRKAEGAREDERDV